LPVSFRGGRPVILYSLPEKTIKLEVKASDTLENVLKKIQDKERISQDQQHQSFAENQVVDMGTLFANSI